MDITRIPLTGFTSNHKSLLSRRLGLQKSCFSPSNAPKLFQDILMNQKTENLPLIADVLPAFAVELRQLLTEVGEPQARLRCRP